MSDRADRVVELLPEAGIDLLLVSNLVNVRYLTGYTGSNGVALIGPDTRAFITDFRYVEQAAVRGRLRLHRRRAPQELFNDVEQVLPEGPLRLGFEDAHVSVRGHARLRELLPDRVELVGVEGIVERLRAVKEPDEVERIRSACRARRRGAGAAARGRAGRAQRARAGARARAGDAAAGRPAPEL